MQEKNCLILVDAHVHIYDCYDLKVFFNSAFKNFKVASEQISDENNFTGVLFLTETREYNYFEKFFNNPDEFSLKTGYSIEKTSEEESLKVYDGNNSVYLIAGEQIITKENLEVLAVGTRKKILNNKSISETINDIIKENAIPVVPWGVGKWLGKREKTVKELINKRNDFFLGDINGRPVFWHSPILFSKGMEKNIFTLPGTDPLPLKTQEGKAGSFGFFFDFDMDLKKPFSCIKNKLLTADKQFNNFGKQEKTINFFKNQLLIKIR